MHISSKIGVNSYSLKQVTLGLVGVYAFSFILRWLKQYEMLIIDPDSTRYIDLAKRWALHGAAYAYDHCDLMDIPPLYSYLISVGVSYGIDPIKVGMIVGISCGAFIPIAVFLISYSIFNRYDYSFLASFLASIQPYLILTSVRLLRDALYLPLLTVGISFACLAIKNKSFLYWLLFSIFITLASATRIEGIVMVPIFLIWGILDLLFETGSFLVKLKYFALSSVLVIVVFFSLTFYIRFNLSGTKATWGNTDLISLKYLGRPHLVE